VRMAAILLAEIAGSDIGGHYFAGRRQKAWRSQPVDATP